MKLEIPLYDIKIKFYFDYDLGKLIKKINRKKREQKWMARFIFKCVILFILIVLIVILLTNNAK